MKAHAQKQGPESLRLVQINENLLMVVLFAAYPVETVNVSDKTALMAAGMYAACLADIEGEILLAAIDRLVKSSDRLPTVAHIRRAVVDIRYGAPRPGGEAWGELRKLMQRHAGRRIPKDFENDVSDPLLLEAIEDIGWSDMLRSENQVADRARFIQLYDDLVRARRSEVAVMQRAVCPSWTSLPFVPPRELETRMLKVIEDGMARAQDEPRRLPGGRQ